jgi:hypothetical protein
MAIQKVQGKNKLLNKVELHPKRTYVSGSWGVSGSIYVFPNRSETQKDNIDERLNLFPIVDGTSDTYDPDTDAPTEDLIIRPYSGDSLEARRIEIYSGNFNKFDTTFVDAVAYEYKSTALEAPGLFGQADEPIVEDVSFTPTQLNEYLLANPGNASVGDKINRLNSDGTTSLAFIYTSNHNWEVNGQDLYNKLPESDRDASALNYEIPLALLLDGADPETYDHAYRTNAVYEANLGTVNYSLGNSSLTGASPEYFQFTGWNYEMQNGFPVQTTTITSKSEVNAWPPELDKWGNNIITNYMISGYSDLSMHPRNKTKKLMSFERSNHDQDSKGTIKQKMLYREYKTRALLNEGWWTENHNSLCLSSWVDTDGTTRLPCLVYPNRDDQYKIDYSTSGVSFNLEFWLKPSENQTTSGCVCQLHNNYAVMLMPDSSTVVNGVPQKFKISLRVNEAADDGAFDATELDHRDGSGTDHVYISDSLLIVEQWHHVSIRWGRNFNNGQMTVYLNNVVIDEFDGIEGTVNSIGRTGLIDISSVTTTDKALFVGAYPSVDSTGQSQIWDDYSSDQNDVSWSLAAVPNGPVDGDTGMLTGYSVTNQLVSELTELRCFNYPRTELEIGENWTLRSRSIDNLTFYIPFYFDAKHEFHTYKPTFKPVDIARESSIYLDPGADLLEEYYGGDSASIASSNVPKDEVLTPYCQNWGYIAGVPFLNVSSHTKEYVKKEIPVVYDMPNMRLLNQKVYPNKDASPSATYTEVEETKILYFLNHWQKLPWLRCWNSLIFPCTVSIKSFANLVVEDDNTLFRNGNKGYIDYTETGNINVVDEAAAKHMFEDERWRQSSNTALLEGTAHETWEIEPDLSDVSSLMENLDSQDVLPPFSPVISIPIIYYGNRIQEETFSLKTKLASGKSAHIVDLSGVLYLADGYGERTNAKVGHISYDNGYLCIFSHLMSDITLEETEISFRGDKNMHVLQFDVKCPSGLGNESKNINYKNLKATPNANETDGIVTYISTVYLHDENLNIVAKVKLAQPIQKREEDSFLFRIKLDF